MIRIERIADPRPATRVAAKGAGKGGGGGGGQPSPHQPQESPNTLRSRSMARILELLSEGPVFGLVSTTTIWEGVFLDGTPVADEAGNFNFAVREGNFRYGLPGQDWIPGWPLSESEVAVSVEALPFDPIVRSLTTPISAIRYKVRIPQLYTQESDGDVVPASVAYAFDLRINGGLWTNFVTERIAGKTMSPYERAVRVQIPGGPYFTTIEARIERIDPAPPSDTANQLMWSSFTEINDGQISYDDSCVVSFTIDAEEFPSIPQRAYLLDGLMLQIPTNYDGRTHGYAGDWDGTFYEQWTNNPAWVLYNLLINERWGLGRKLDVAAIDKWSFYECGVLCDGAVPDGTGGMEIRFACNCVINTRQDAYTVLQAIASNMLAQLYYANGTVFLVQDRRITSPTRIFGPADVEGGLFDYTSADVRSRYTAAAITWNDPGNRYEPAVELVQDPTMVALQGYRETAQTLFGCTSRGQAIRYGRWLIYTSQFETEIVSFRTGLENADLRPGDLIMLSDPSRVGARLAGRLVHDDGADTITFDARPAEITTAGWSVYVTVGSAGEGETPQVLSLTVTELLAANQVRVIGKSMAVPAGSMWLARSGSIEPTPWRVATINERATGSYEVLATEYHVEKFDYVEQGVLIPPPAFTLIPTGPLTNASDLAYREYIYLDGNGFPQFGVLVSWTPSADPRVTRYQLEMSGPGGDYRRFAQIAGVAQEVPNMRQGEWFATLVAFDNVGRRSQPISMTFIPIGLTAKPESPKALFLSPQANLVTVSWVPTGEIDIAYYWLKWAPQTDGSATWPRATTSIARVDRNTTQVNTPLRSGTFMLKAIDALGQESETYVTAIMLPQQNERIHVIDQEEQPTWPGDRGALWHQNVGELWLPPPSVPDVVPDDIFPGDRAVTFNKTPTRIAVYGFGDVLDLGIVTANVALTGIVDAYGNFVGTVMADWSTLASVDPLASGGVGVMGAWRPLASAIPLAMGSSAEWDGHIEFRVAQADGVTFGPWTPLAATVITGRLFEWRLIGALYDLATTMRAVRAAVIVEIPLRNIQGSDAALDGTGHLTVVYPVPFLETPAVQITARQSLVAGGNIVITASDETSFTVEHRNAANAVVAGGSIDYFVQGYGGHA